MITIFVFILNNFVINDFILIIAVLPAIRGEREVRK